MLAGELGSLGPSVPSSVVGGAINNAVDQQAANLHRSDLPLWSNYKTPLVKNIDGKLKRKKTILGWTISNLYTPFSDSSYFPMVNILSFYSSLTF